MSAFSPRRRQEGLEAALTDKADSARLKKGLAARQTEIVPITPAISQRAAELIDALALSHGMRLADALIGATAIELQATLITATSSTSRPPRD